MLPREVRLSRKLPIVCVHGDSSMVGNVRRHIKMCDEKSVCLSGKGIIHDVVQEMEEMGVRIVYFTCDASAR